MRCRRVRFQISDSEPDDTGLTLAVKTSPGGAAAQFSTAAIPAEQGPPASALLPPKAGEELLPNPEALQKAGEESQMPNPGTALSNEHVKDPAGGGAAGGDGGGASAAVEVADRGDRVGEELIDGMDARYMDAAAWF